MTHLAWHVFFQDEVTSTMDAVKPLLGEPVCTALAARTQIKGRGRRGHPWVCEAGNLFVTCAFPMSLPENRLPEWAFGAGVALARTTASYLGEIPCTLKWPNDLLIGGKKVAGLLLEPYQDPRTHTLWALLGVGVNLAHAPDLVDRPASALSQVISPSPSPEAFLERFLKELCAWYDVWCKEGFEPVRHEWTARAHPVGTPLIVREGAHQIMGTFLDLDPQGRLLLEKDNGQLVNVTAADVFIGAMT